MNRCFIRTIIALLCTSCFASSAPLRIQFVKGNIVDKTAAVRESSGEDAAFLSKEAIDFALEHKVLLGNDRDLDTLALAGVLALPANSVASLDYGEREALSEKFVKLFSLFPSDTVRIAILNKAAALRDSLPTEPCIVLLNDYLANAVSSAGENGVVKAAVRTLGEIGDSRSFSVLFTARRQQKWPEYGKDIDEAIALLADKSLPQVIAVIREGNVKNGIRPLFDVLIKNEKISASFKSEIAENVLSETIYIANNASSITRETVSLQVDALDVIVQNKWTRSAPAVLSFFDLAEREYKAGVMTDGEFVKAINAAAEIAPVDASSRLASYLAALNRQTESGAKVSETIALALIGALGRIGNKSSFDTLLYVTYVNYPEPVIAAARDALARLKW
ncbi:hypothetical protein [Treponema socranskii]|uniref:hypothetical protein n=1 Tax=Treponema socranskii TaxID=53419 RepID=UPI002870C944|nr:hypothetical protein [Treponema socranskii]MDR9859678.1 hypothetical protein [Treponema socranskii]